MIALIIGKPDSGKSKRAEALTAELAQEGQKIYLATMIPYGKEGEERVKKHRLMRADSVFFTIECPYDLKMRLKDDAIFQGATCLLECISNLVANEMHADGRKACTDEGIVDLVFDEIAWLAQKCRHLVLVGNEFDKDSSFDEETKRYIRLNHLVNEKIRVLSDHVETI
ncbi:MAG: bifunctional adenosylcobinamide kinase/adenosylcobinamide-phosphate guanylyltransferase [Lachnospiraceae bacterium]|nr:bifunctional adenosylcobinamide kinase/adenosylcobinamide-phosphate guanylyltransferase [Lachnospiraceae bacterium]